MSLYAQRYNLSVIKTAEPVKTITWNKDGTYFGYAERNNIVLRNTNGYSVIQRIPTYKSDINFLQFSAVTAGSNTDQLVTLHASGLLDFRILPDVEPTLSMSTENSEPTVLTYSHNGNYLAVGNENGTVILYMQNYLTQTAVSQQIGNLGVPITALAFSRDNKYLIIGAADNSITLVEVASRKIVGGYAYHSKNKVPVLFTSDSKTIIMTTGDSTIGFFDLDFNRKNYYTTYHDILSMKISADDRYLIILTTDNVFSYYDLQTHEIRKYIPAFNETKILAYAFDANCTKLAVSHEDGSLYVLDVASVLLDFGQQRNSYTTSETAESLTEFDFRSEEPVIPAPVIKEQEPDLNTEYFKSEEKTPKEPELPIHPEVKPEPKKPEEKPIVEEKSVTPKQEEKQKKAEERKKEQEQKKAEKAKKEEAKKLEEPKKKVEKVPTEKKTVKENIAYKFVEDEEDIKTLFKDGHGILADVGIGKLKEPYLFDFSLNTGYLNYNLIQPFYFGGLFSASLGLPSYNFPYSYNSPNGVLQNPFLTCFSFYAPIGITLYPLKNSLEVYVDVDFGLNLYTLWNGSLFNNISTKLYPVFTGGLRVGVAWDFINLSLCGRIDPVNGLKINIELGTLINVGGTRTIGSLKQEVK